MTRANPIPPEARVMESQVSHIGLPVPGIWFHTGADWDWQEASLLLSGPTSAVFCISVEGPDSVQAYPLL